MATELERTPGAKAYLSSKTVCLHFIELDTKKDNKTRQGEA